MLNNFLSQIYKTTLSYCFISLLLFLYRLTYTIRFGWDNLIDSNFSELIHAFLLGWKFDNVIIMYILSLAILLNVIYVFFTKPLIKTRINKISKYWLFFCSSILCIILIIDHQFYTYFQSHLNIFVFEFFKDDTSAVLKSMWTDHPILLVSLLLIIQFVFAWIVFKRIWSKSNVPNFITNLKSVYKWAIIAAFFTAFAFSLRGNLFSVFPLKIEDAIISNNRFINKIPLNGAFSLIDAFNDYEKTNQTISKKDILTSRGYTSINEVFNEYYSLNSSISNYSDSSFFQYTATDSFLSQSHINVVFFLMESFGSYYLNFQSDSLNLLGELEKHWYDDYHFTNFLSSTRGTIFSLENILINKNWPSLSNTSRRFETFNSSIAFPFYNAGYDTYFITGGQIAWRNLHEYLPNQYFNYVYGQTGILKNNNHAKTNTWGVYDEYLFEDIFNLLSTNAKSPKLICALTTTNHTPYELPEKYSGYPIHICDSIKNVIISNNEIAELSFRAYQYANDCLGKFMTKLKNSPLAENTIVIATGDHNSYTLFPYDNNGFAEIDKHKVPLYIYIPDTLRKKEYKTYQNRFGSHKDIFPTIFNLCLSNQKYFSLGNNLFDTNKPDSLFYSINESFFIGQESYSKAKLSKIVKARNTLIDYYFANN